MKQVLILKKDRKKMEKNFQINLEKRKEDGNTEDFKPVVKLFCPYSSATWLISEMEPDTNIGFGLCDMGFREPEIGYVDVTELMELKKGGLQMIERDAWFSPEKTLSQYAEEARTNGFIQA